MASYHFVDQQLGLRLALTSVSAVVAEFVTFPIDITKTRLQLQGEMGVSSSGGTKGTFETTLGIVQEEGFGGLYRGLSPALLRHAFYTSIRITTYEQLRNTLQHGDSHNASVAQKAFIGGASGMIGQFLVSPADLVKVRMQSDGRLMKLGYPPRYIGLRDAFSKIIQTEGMLGLWKGVAPNTQRAVLVNVGELACYDHTKQLVISQRISQDNIFAHTLASMMSGLCSTVLSCPADVVKTRMMNQAMGSNSGVAATESPYKNSIDCLFRTIRVEGMCALWKGFFPTWMRLGPWQFVFWVSYEQLRKTTGLSSF